IQSDPVIAHCSFAGLFIFHGNIAIVIVRLLIVLTGIHDNEIAWTHNEYWFEYGKKKMPVNQIQHELTTRLQGRDKLLKDLFILFICRKITKARKEIENAI